MLYVIGTPIGNLSDISKRAVETLSLVDVVFAEDTRTALNLLNALNIKKPCKSYYKDNETKASKELIQLLLNGDNIALISEAGMPCISDPGAVVIQEVIKNGLEYEIIQGPTALIHGLIASGFSGSSFYFHGFLPHRVKETLTLLLNYFPAPVAVTREATKMFEETVFVYNEEDIEKINIKGEFVIVVNNKVQDTASQHNEQRIDYNKIINELLSDGLSSKDILKVMKTLGLKRNEAYELINKVQNK